MALGTLLERMFVSIQADLSGLTEEMNRASRDVRKQTEGMSKSFNDMGRKVLNVGKVMSVGVTLPLVGIGVKAIQTASDVEEMQAKFGTVFGSLAKDVAEWSSTTARELNRSKFDLQAYASSFQDTFVPMGFARDQAAELSKQVTQLGIDLASFNNKAEPEVMAALQSAIVGNHETMRQFGVIITQTTLDMELLRMGVLGGVKAASEQEKIQARLNMIMAGTSDAHGDAARTADGFANQMRGLSAATTELAAEFGKHLLPLATDMVGKLTDLVRWFGSLEDGTKKTIVQVAAIAAVIGPAVVAFGAMLSAIGGILAVVPALVSAGTAIAGAIAIVGGPITLTVAAIAGLVAAYVAYKDDVHEAVESVYATVTDRFNSMMNLFVRVKDSVTNSVTLLVGVLEDKLVGVLSGIVDSVTDKIERVEATFAWLYDKVVGNSWVPDMVDEISSQFDRLQKEMVDPSQKATEEISQQFEDISNDMGDHLRRFIKTGKLDMKGFVADISGGLLSDAADSFSKVITETLQRSFTGLAGSIAGGIGGSGGGLFSALGSLFNGLFDGFRAGGGVVPPWKSFVAGERGAELIEQDGPSGARRISTAGKTASMGGGMRRVHVTVNGARGNAEIQQMVRSGVMQGIGVYDKQVGSSVRRNLGRYE